MAANKDGEDIHVTVLHQDEGFVYFPLSEKNDQRQDIARYITALQAEIEAGVYQTKLVAMEDEEVCC
ncbi:hypothetical protein [Paraliobacillus ryukyuensis]|uniref:hypothetical protein n=1 Tax=Paraliobacillus ryukyuensis TaxID=200904 RepID=UPI0009A64DB0|nr:hypothetical protein [Paraliobacillus ryukyuensis]